MSEEKEKKEDGDKTSNLEGSPLPQASLSPQASLVKKLYGEMKDM